MLVGPRLLSTAVGQGDVVVAVVEILEVGMNSSIMCPQERQ